MYNTLSYNSSLYNRYVVAVLGDDEETITINSALGILANDVIEINTDTMCVYLNDSLIMEHVADLSTFFKLLPGANTITITGTGTVDVEISRKDRWL